MSRPRANRPGRYPVAIHCQVSAGLPTTAIRRWAQTVRRRLASPAGELSIAVVKPTASRRLNRRWRGIDRPTNVLSWRLSTPDVFRPSPAERQWGEIVLCPAMVRREYRRYRRTYAQHFRSLLVHGLMHLCGFDHHTPAAAERWRQREEAITVQS